MVALRFAVQSYQSRTLEHSAQRCVNYFAESAPPDAKSNVVVYNSPGIVAFADGFAGAVRGFINMGGVLYVVAGDKFYSVDSAGTETLIGSINTATGNVAMAKNRAIPQELCFVDGADGWTYDTSNGLREITDGDFSPADTVTFQDGYFIFNNSGTSQFFISAIDDGRTYSATDFANAEGSPDDVVAVTSSHRELWVFGETTTEVYFNSGNADFPFERIQGAYLERGCGAAFSIAEDDNTLFWLGDDKIVYRANGYTPQRISTHAIEEQLRTMTDVSDAVAFFITISGHKLYHLIFPTGRKCFVYDAATQLWHERESFGARHWRGTSYVEAFDKHLIGDAFQGRIGELDMDTFTEFGDTMQGILTSAPISQDEKRLFHRRVEMAMERGVGGATDPLIWLEHSDDGGRTWSLRKPMESLGKIGEYRERLRWLRLGQARNRVYKLTIADAVKRTVINANVDIAAGTN